ncbi:hypothetical protein [Streptococcus halotolerans]|uniref:hypothetical protein n=1 Tax=Streptococcus halotolerans TaxID=1814128 RepID=UPI00078964A5|nr:hypothetical protein [Streptococcus halotolerans]
MTDVSLLLVGSLVSMLGIVNIKGNISTIHSYNRRKVKEEDVPKYGRIVGIGTLIIGISLMIGSILPLLNINTPLEYVIVPMGAIGISLILYGQFKYNKGIF